MANYHCSHGNGQGTSNEFAWCPKCAFLFAHSALTFTFADAGMPGLFTDSWHWWWNLVELAFLDSAPQEVFVFFAEHFCHVESSFQLYPSFLPFLRPEIDTFLLDWIVLVNNTSTHGKMVVPNCDRWLRNPEAYGEIWILQYKALTYQTIVYQGE